jgi:hypothetical protein
MARLVSQVLCDARTVRQTKGDAALVKMCEEILSRGVQAAICDHPNPETPLSIALPDVTQGLIDVNRRGKALSVSQNRVLSERNMSALARSEAWISFGGALAQM